MTTTIDRPPVFTTRRGLAKLAGTTDGTISRMNDRGEIREAAMLKEANKRVPLFDFSALDAVRAYVARRKQRATAPTITSS